MECIDTKVRKPFITKSTAENGSLESNNFRWSWGNVATLA